MVQLVVLPLIGLAFLVLGWLLTTRRSVAEWGLGHGRAQIWVKLLGPERAYKLTKYFFGPFTMLLGVLTLLVGTVGVVDHVQQRKDAPGAPASVPPR